MREMTLDNLQGIVENDSKSRYHLKRETDEGVEPPKEVWWIRANQGHSLKVGRSWHAIGRRSYLTQEVKLDLQPVVSAVDIPTGIAVHGTNRKAWELIRT